MNFETKKGYRIYIIVMIIITVPILTAPIFLYNHADAFQQIHDIYSYFCHQLTSRSHCFFPETGSIEDCHETSDFSSSKALTVTKGGFEGYKFPVCARDLGFYFFALIGGFFLSSLNKHNETDMPNPLWLIIAVLPLALDGGSQFIGLRESTNILRFITGSLAGFVIPFYIVPMLNRILR